MKNSNVIYYSLIQKNGGQAAPYGLGVLSSEYALPRGSMVTREEKLAKVQAYKKRYESCFELKKGMHCKMMPLIKLLLSRSATIQHFLKVEIHTQIKSIHAYVTF